MDYRHTEDFARAMEAAALRAHAMRRQAIADFWSDVGELVRRGWRALAARLARRAAAGKVMEA